MRRVNLVLKRRELAELEKDAPRSEKNAAVRQRAERLVAAYLGRRGWKETGRGKGVDMVFKRGGRQKEVEVKGTAAGPRTHGDPVWRNLLVSGKPSFKALRRGVPLYRVVDVNGSRPVAFVLTYSRDFELVSEPRWRVRRRPKA